MRSRTASELSKKTVDVQTSVLIYSMDPTAEEIFNMFDVEEEETTFDEIIDLFDGYFTPKVNVIHERAVFHKRSQLAGDNIETYVRLLYELAEHADFRDKESTIRDRLVVGLRDRELSKKLQLQPDLTLKTAIDVARQHEQVKVQMSEQQTPVVNAVKSRTSQGRKYSQKGAQRQHGVSQHPKCGRCGRDSHRKPTECPANGKICHNCGLKEITSLHAAKENVKRSQL